MHARLCGAVAILILTLGAHAQAQSFADCPPIKNDKQRLACFDSAAARQFGTTLTASPSAALPRDKSSEPVAEAADAREPQAEIAATPAGDPATNAIDEFGGERFASKAKEQKEELRQIRSQIVRVETVGYKTLVFHLDNGQVWRQTDGGRTTFFLRKNGAYYALISRGFMGSYNLTIEGVNGRAKVVRIH
ncbi:MAG TPA: hypothetical protein VNH64_05860 [Parvularculaceae bacterium]|nr:hypothetical protein [Parvularculaceae bacterium]